MKKPRDLLILLFGLSLTSCKAVPPEIAAFLAKASYLNARNNVYRVDYGSLIKQYRDAQAWENNDETAIIGLMWTEIHYQITDDVVSYRHLDSYGGSRIKVIDDENRGIPELANQKVLSKTDTYTYDDAKDKYEHEVVYSLAVDPPKESTTYTMDDEIAVSDAKYAVWKKIFGDTQFHHNGLYYGSFLAQQTKNFARFMSINADNSILTYDPPRTGQDPQLQQYADYRLQVDKRGMVLNSEYEVYDAENDEYSRLSATGVYGEKEIDGDESK